MSDPVYGAFLCFASEAAQVAGEPDGWGAEYERIRTAEFDINVVAAIAAAAKRSEGRTWRPSMWVWSDRELWSRYVEAAADGAAVIFYVGEEALRWRKGRRVARLVVSTPLAARMTGRVVEPAPRRVC
jgi:hypothetical protein